MRTSLISAATSSRWPPSLAMLSGCASAQAATPVATETTTSQRGRRRRQDRRQDRQQGGEHPPGRGERREGALARRPHHHRPRQALRELDALFAFAPDTHVEGEQSRTASGDWTTVIRTVAGTATTSGKPFKIWVATISHQTNGVIDEEYLFWNDKTLKAQIGS